MPAVTFKQRTAHSSQNCGVFQASSTATSARVISADLRGGTKPSGSQPGAGTRTVTAPQALFLMNGDEIARASAAFAERLKAGCAGDLKAAVDLAYRTTLVRSPTPAEAERALTYLADDPARLKGLAWLMFNLDEFLYVR